MTDDLSPDEQAVAAARAQHHGTIVDTVGDEDSRYSWLCACNSGRHWTAGTDWETAATELNSHENAAIVAALDLPARDARVRADERVAVRRELLVQADVWLARAAELRSRNLHSGYLYMYADAVELLADLVVPEVSHDQPA